MATPLVDEEGETLEHEVIETIAKPILKDELEEVAEVENVQTETKVKES